MGRITLVMLLASLVLGSVSAEDDEEMESVPVATPSAEDVAGENLLRALTRLSASWEKVEQNVPDYMGPTPTPDLRPFAIQTAPPVD